MFGILFFFCFPCIVMTESTTWISGSYIHPKCNHLKYDIEEYELFKLPIDFYANPEPVPGDYWHDNHREIPEMKKYYNILPSDRTDIITFYGYYTNPKVNFTVLFGEGDDKVNYMLNVVNGRVTFAWGFEDNSTVQLPQDFAIEVSFTIDGVKVNVYDVEKGDSFKSDTCDLYRAIPIGISHMAVFSDCDTVEIEMITMQIFTDKPELYHMHVPQNLASEYFVSGHPVFTLYGTPAKSIVIGITDKRDFVGGRTIITGQTLQCDTSRKCTVEYLKTPFTYTGPADEISVQGSVDHIWFLCTKKVNKWCKFDDSLLIDDV